MYEYAPKPTALEDDLDLGAVAKIIWQNRLFIALITSLFVALAIGIAFYLPNIYRVDVLLAPAENVEGGGVNKAMSQLGGIASLAGVKLGGTEVDKTQLALAVLQSRRFVTSFVNRHDILVPLMAGKRWDQSTGKLEIDPELYDVRRKTWVRKVEPPLRPKPSALEAYEVFRESVTATVDDENGLITISVEHVSPKVAVQWAQWLVEDINNEMRHNDAQEAKKFISYLRTQLNQTSVADIRSVFFELVEQQMQRMMLAEARPQYVFRIIDPAFEPEKRASPNRILIAALGLVLGFMVASVSVLLAHCMGFSVRLHAPRNTSSVEQR